MDLELRLLLENMARNSVCFWSKVTKLIFSLLKIFRLLEEYRAFHFFLNSLRYCFPGLDYWGTWISSIFVLYFLPLKSFPCLVLMKSTDIIPTSKFSSRVLIPLAGCLEFLKSILSSLKLEYCITVGAPLVSPDHFKKWWY